MILVHKNIEDIYKKIDNSLQSFELKEFLSYLPKNIHDEHLICYSYHYDDLILLRDFIYVMDIL